MPLKPSILFQTLLKKIPDTEKVKVDEAMNGIYWNESFEKQNFRVTTTTVIKGVQKTI